MISSDQFNFFVPLELVKGTKAGQEMYIKGICSSEVEDSDGETLVPAGYDVSALLTNGFLNYNHQAGKTASAIIGEPTKAEIVNNGKDLYLEGFLYPDSDEAKAVYKLAQTLEKNSSKRRLGFSIEGKALEKDPLNPKRITKAKITGVAITAMPKNPNTLLSIMKGEYAEAFVDEEIEKSLNIDSLIKEYKDWTGSDSHAGSEGNIKEFFENYHEDNQDLIPEFTEALKNKAMTAEAGDRVTSKESVEGGIKVLDTLTKEKEEESKKLKKSEVYNKIFEKYGKDINIVKAQKIYQLTQEFNTKLYNMTGEETISKALENTFDFIDQQINLLKGEEAGKVEDTKEEPVKKDETIVKSEEEIKAEEEAAALVKSQEEAELQKAEDEAAAALEAEMLEKGEDVDHFGLALKPFVLAELEKGESEESIIDGLVIKGLDAEFCTSLVKGCVDEMNSLKENGGETSQVTAAIQKSEDGNDLIKADQVELIKSEILGQFEQAQVNILGQIEQRFKALGSLLKSQGSEITILKSENQTLSNALQSAQQNINLIANQPVGTRSIVKSTQVERFQNQDIQKSQSGKDVYNLQKGEDVAALTQRLSDEYDIVKSNGGKNTPLENALFEISVAKSFDRNTLMSVKPTLDRMNIEIY